MARMIRKLQYLWLACRMGWHQIAICPFDMCGRCGYPQNERVPTCSECGYDLRSESNITSIRNIIYWKLSIQYLKRIVTLLMVLFGLFVICVFVVHVKTIGMKGTVAAYDPGHVRSVRMEWSSMGRIQLLVGDIVLWDFECERQLSIESHVLQNEGEFDPTKYPVIVISEVMFDKLANEPQQLRDYVNMRLLQIMPQLKNGEYTKAGHTPALTILGSAAIVVSQPGWDQNVSMSAEILDDEFQGFCKLSRYRGPVLEWLSWRPRYLIPPMIILLSVALLALIDRFGSPQWKREHTDLIADQLLMRGTISSR